MGKLIIIEAGDGCGKATQTKMLYDKLLSMNIDVKKIEYPDYNSEACAPVKMYLRGDFGGHAEDVNAYAASVFFAVDRYASYRMKWKKDYDKGTVILADRYVTSNMVHQAVKIEDKNEREDFLRWLWDTEFVKMGLPVPDKVIFLDVAPDFSSKLINDRVHGDESKKDIHEKDKLYLAKCYKLYKDIAAKYKWQIVNCVKENKLRSIEEIHQEIFSIVKNIL